MLFGLLKDRKHPIEDNVWTIWTATPTRKDLVLARRWGVMLSTKVSREQFNVYTTDADYLVTMQSNNDSEVERDVTGFFKGGKCVSIADAWEAAANYISNILIASGTAGLSCQAAVLFDTTPETEPLHLATFEFVGNCVQETRHCDPDTRARLAPPSLPQPPPATSRFVQLLTMESERAIRSRSGELYEAILTVLLEGNPGCFSTRQEVAAILPSFLWPPSPIENLCADFPHIPYFPCAIERDGHRWDVLVIDLYEHVRLNHDRFTTRCGFTKAFGGVQGMQQRRREFVAQGGTSEAFDLYICALVRRAESDGVFETAGID